MNLVLCTERSLWNTVLGQVAPQQLSFLHSWEWGEMQRAFGRPVCRYIVRQGDANVAALTCMVMPLPFGRHYLFSPYGPAVVAGMALDYRALLRALARTEMAQEYRAVFWRCEPLDADFPAGLGVRVHDVEPSTTRVLDVSRGPEALLSDMKQKTRYNIRLAEKKGVAVEWYSGNDATRWNQLSAEWWTLVSETSARHGIRSHTQEYYDTMMHMLGADGLLEVGVARHEGTVLAMQLCIQYRGTTTYVHGASTERKKEFMAPYALQWSAIQRAAGRGDRYYDFYGVAPEGDSQHYLASVSRFKEGFGGSVRSFYGTVELPLSPLWFALYRLAKRVRP